MPVIPGAEGTRRKNEEQGATEGGLGIFDGRLLGHGRPEHFPCDKQTEEYNQENVSLAVPLCIESAFGQRQRHQQHRLTQLG